MCGYKALVSFYSRKWLTSGGASGIIVEISNPYHDERQALNERFTRNAFKC